MISAWHTKIYSQPKTALNVIDICIEMCKPIILKSYEPFIINALITEWYFLA